MPDRHLMSGTQAGQTIWHQASAAAVADGPQTVLALFNGRVTFANGEQGDYAGVETIVMGDHAEPFSGTHTFLLADGSTCSQSFDGGVTHRDAAGRISGAGKWRIISATGRFEGLDGGGPFAWSIEADTYHGEFRAELDLT